MTRALVVDDDEDLAELAACCLRSAGCDVQVACDGAEGLRLAEAFAPDIVLLDLIMPGMHGFEACRRLRAARPGLGILVVSGKPYPVDRRAALAAGADAFLPKPWKSGELLSAVRALLDPESGRRPLRWRGAP